MKLHTPWRKAYLSSVWVAMSRKSNYDKFPCVPVSTNAAVLDAQWPAEFLAAPGGEINLQCIIELAVGR